MSSRRTRVAGAKWTRRVRFNRVATARGVVVNFVLAGGKRTPTPTWDSDQQSSPRFRDLSCSPHFVTAPGPHLGWRHRRIHD